MEQSLRHWDICEAYISLENWERICTRRVRILLRYCSRKCSHCIIFFFIFRASWDYIKYLIQYLYMLNLHEKNSLYSMYFFLFYFLIFMPSILSRIPVMSNYMCLCWSYLDPNSFTSPTAYFTVGICYKEEVVIFKSFHFISYNF